MNNGWEALAVLLSAAIILLHSLIAALFSFGWTTLFDDGQIFGKAGAWLDEKLPTWASKPLYGCAICNAFWVATLMYWIFWGSTWYIWLMTGCISVGVNSIIIGFQNRLTNIADVMEDSLEEPKTVVLAKHDY